RGGKRGSWRPVYPGPRPEPLSTVPHPRLPEAHDVALSRGPRLARARRAPRLRPARDAPRRAPAPPPRPGAGRGAVRPAASGDGRRPAHRPGLPRAGTGRPHDRHPAPALRRSPPRQGAPRRRRGDVSDGPRRRARPRTGAPPGTPGRAVALHGLRDGLRTREPPPVSRAGAPSARQLFAFFGSPWQRLYFLPEPHGH